MNTNVINSEKHQERVRVYNRIVNYACVFCFVIFVGASLLFAVTFESQQVMIVAMASLAIFLLCYCPMLIHFFTDGEHPDDYIKNTAFAEYMQTRIDNSGMPAPSLDEIKGLKKGIMPCRVGDHNQRGNK